MCDVNCVEFAEKEILPELIGGKIVLEVGSWDLCGGIRKTIEKMNPRTYIGTDIVSGSGVDRVCAAEHLVEAFGEDSFDFVFSTCVLEHIQDWKAAISNMKRVCRRGGKMLIIVPSAWPAHGHPHDYWRFSKEDIRHILSDFEIEKIEEKPSWHGAREIGSLVYVIAKKTNDFEETNLRAYRLERVIIGDAMKSLAEIYQSYQSPESHGDKGTVHSYIPVYEELLAPYRKCKNVLEIGILNGQSLQMWEEYFPDSNVYGIDITDKDLKPLIASGKHNIRIFNACDAAKVEEHFGGMKFDVIIEDASHALADQLKLYKNFKHHLTENGIYIVEDVDKIDQVRQQFLDLDTQKVTRIIDRRLVKHRFDDVLIVIGGIQDQKSKFDYINNMFNHLCGTVSDMQAHMPRILKYACQSKRIVEFGVWDCTSTWGLLAGKPKWMRSYDIVRRPEVDMVERITANSGIDFKFVHKSTLDAEIDECDLLFIDSYHSYDQLKSELSKHSKHVRKFIMFHDTTTFGNCDQTPAGGKGGGKGLWPAIEEFLGDRSVWKGIVRHMDCNGLTIIERVGEEK